MTCSYLITRLCMSFFIRESQLSLKGLLSKMRWNNNLLSDSFQILRSLYISTLWEKKSLWLWIQDSIWGVVIKIHSLYEVRPILEIYWTRNTWKNYEIESYELLYYVCLYYSATVLQYQVHGFDKYFQWHNFVLVGGTWMCVYFEIAMNMKIMKDWYTLVSFHAKHSKYNIRFFFFLNKKGLKMF